MVHHKIYTFGDVMQRMKNIAALADRVYELKQRATNKRR